MKPSQVSIALRRIASGIDSCKKPVRSDFVSRDLRLVLAAMRTAQGRTVVIDNFKNVAYPFGTPEAADAKVQQLLSALNENDRQYFRDILNLAEDDDLSSVTAATLAGADSEGILVTDESGSRGVGMAYDTAGRETFFHAWPEDFEGAGEEDWLGAPIGVFETVGAADGAPVPMTEADW